MGWISQCGKCRACGYIGAMTSDGCPICQSLNLDGSYEGNGFVVVFILFSIISLILIIKAIL